MKYSDNKVRQVGGGCDGCELMFVGMPEALNAIDTSAGWYEEGQKLLVTGTVYKRDGKTPAADVIVYYWQTDNNGLYSPSKEVDKQAGRHGHIRGWIRTDKTGRYSVYTIRPAPYPDADIPAHIHISIKEPDLNEYYIDDLVFDDDILLTGKLRSDMEGRGGSGILRILLSGEMQIAEHNIILGLNIPDYPVTNASPIKSGLEIGEDNPSFIPFHAFGPDKGTRTCPVCKYGRFHGIIFFAGRAADFNEVKQWLVFLDKESVERSRYLKVYFVYGNERGFTRQKRQKELEKLGMDLQLKNIALTYVPSFNDEESEVHLNKINPEAENTFIIYRHRTIVDRYVNLKPNEINFNLISETLDNTKSEFFNLKEPAHH